VSRTTPSAAGGGRADALQTGRRSARWPRATGCCARQSQHGRCTRHDSTRRRPAAPPSPLKTALRWGRRREPGVARSRRRPADRRRRRARLAATENGTGGRVPSPISLIDRRAPSCVSYGPQWEAGRFPSGRGRPRRAAVGVRRTSPRSATLARAVRPTDAVFTATALRSRRTRFESWRVPASVLKTDARNIRSRAGTFEASAAGLKALEPMPAADGVVRERPCTRSWLTSGQRTETACSFPARPYSESGRPNEHEIASDLVRSAASRRRLARFGERFLRRVFTETRSGTRPRRPRAPRAPRGPLRRQRANQSARPCRRRRTGIGWRQIEVRGNIGMSFDLARTAGSRDDPASPSCP